MKVLIIGSGGREHALAWKAAQSPLVEKVLVAPGNAGTAGEPGVENVAVGAEDISALIDLARERDVGLTIVGPEAPLVAGICDRFAEGGLACFGPSAAAAQLEGSKAFTKDFLARHGIPTAAYRVFDDEQEALRYVRKIGAPVVIKADGLAAGKGVILAASEPEAETAVRDMLSGNRFGSAGSRVVVEAFLTGEEASFIAIVDGEKVLPLATSQDHKARDDGDVGPNTGGMGAYSPAPVVTTELHRRIMEEVIEPTVKGMVQDGNEFRGFLYAGIMVAEDGTPNVLEFNVRFGDPETQPIMMRMQSDLVAHCLAALNGSLEQQVAQWDVRACLGVVAAAQGYPDAYPKGDLIQGVDVAEEGGAKVFHAGTSLDQGKLVTAGGRVLCVCALGDDVSEAQHAAYAALEKIYWPGLYFRRDIGHRAISRS